MGLDAVMIVIEIEQTFGIKISDVEAVGLRTPQLLSTFVADRVQALPEEFCRTQQTYYRLRRGFRAALPALGADLRLDTPLKELSDREQWPAVWDAVRAAANASEWPPSVAWPTWRNLNTGPKTIRDLVWHIAIELTPRPGQAPSRWTRQQVEHTIRRIILEESGVEPDYDAQKTFPDLGID
jgi:acyl carrier protein